MDKSGKNSLIYIYIYIYTHPWTYKHINTDTHIHIYTLCVIQVRSCFLTLCLKVFRLFAFLLESGKLFQIEGPI